MLLCIFFFKQKTAYDMRISDWSSDVCSSDLFDSPTSHSHYTRQGSAVDRREGTATRNRRRIHPAATCGSQEQAPQRLTGNELMRKSTLLCAVSLAAVLASPAVAQELTIGISAVPSALVPPYHNLGPHSPIRRHMFESLRLTDANQRLSPGLAPSHNTPPDTHRE